MFQKWLEARYPAKPPFANIPAIAQTARGVEYITPLAFDVMKAKANTLEVENNQLRDELADLKYSRADDAKPPASS